MTPGEPPASLSPDGLDDHPDFDALADLDAGLLDPPTAARVGGHAAACPRCRSALAAFDAVRADLRSAPPPALPPAVAARLDETLTQLRREHFPAAVGSQAAAPSGQAPAGPGPPIPDLNLARERHARERQMRARHARARRLTSWAAAGIVVVAAIVGVGTALVQGGNDSSVTQGAALAPDGQSSSRGRGAEPGGGGEGAGANGDTASEPRAAPSPADPPQVPRLPSYSRESLAAALPTISKRSAVEIIVDAGVAGPGGPMADSRLRNACLQSIPGVVGRPVAVEFVLFELRGAYVFVFEQDGRRSVVVVASTCGTGVPADVLYRTD